MKFLVPLSWLAAAGGLLTPRTAPALPPAAIPVAVRQVFIPASLPAATAPAADDGTRLAIALVTIWAVGVTVVLLSWWRQWRPLRDAVRGATALRLDTTRDAVDLPVVSSRNLREPGIVGIRRPVLVLPDGIVDLARRSLRGRRRRGARSSRRVQ